MANQKPPYYDDIGSDYGCDDRLDEHVSVPSSHLIHYEDLALFAQAVAVLRMYRESHHDFCIATKPQGLCDKCQMAEEVFTKLKG